VFISKLRKKLEPDPQIKIVNIRGVGYKLVLNN
jgi:DNA-binding response OmpR family regulator